MNDNQNKRIALIYCRVSSDRQKNEGHGLESQEQRCRVFAYSENLIVERVFSDSYTGGGDFMNRPKMRELLDHIDSNPHKQYTVIFDDLKRFARDTVFHLKLRKEFGFRDIELKCLNFNFEDTPEGKFIETIMAAQGELEREQNKRQVIQKQKARLEKGCWSFFPPPGYAFYKDALHGKLLKPDKKASIIKEAFEGFESGVFQSQRDVQEFLQSQNFREKNKKVYLSKVKDLLMRPIYAGLIEYPKWEVARRQGHHKAIISESTFDNVQRILLEGRRVKPRKDIRKDFPLRGLVCSVGSSKPYTASYTKGRNNQYAYYRDTDKESEFFDKSFSKDVVEKQMEEFLSTITPSQEVLDLTEALILEEWNKRKVKKDIGKNEIEKELKILQKEKDAYIERIGKTTNENVISAYERKIELLSISEQTLSEKLNNPRNLSDFGTAFSAVMEYVKNPLKQWKIDDLNEKRTIVQIVFDGVAEYDINKGFGTAKVAPIYSVFKTFSVSDFRYVEMGGIEPPCI